MKSVVKYLSTAAAAVLCNMAQAVDVTCVRLSFEPEDVGTRTTEWYAVCGSVNEEFSGITADGAAVDPSDKIYGFLKVNNLGRITCTFDRDGMDHFFVYLLDTADAEGVVPDSKPTVINGLQKKVSATIEDNSLSALSLVNASGTTMGFTAEPSGASDARIVAIDPTSKADKVLITVEGTHPALKYNVRNSEDVADINEAALGDKPRTSETGTVTFEVEKNTESGAQFFKLVRQPLN